MGLEALLQRYLDSEDEDAIARLVERTRPRLLAIARRISPVDAEDAVQTAYLALVRKRDALEVPVLAWLSTVVIRVAYRRRAQAARQHEIAERLAPPSPLQSAIGKEERELLVREVWRLPDPFRDPLLLHHLNGLSTAETARLLGLNDSTLRTRLQRGRFLLRTRLTKVLYPVVAIPWLLADTAAAAFVLGGTMKGKSLLVVAVVLLLAASGVFLMKSRDRADPPARAADHALAARDRAPAPGTATDEGAAEGAATTPDAPAFASGLVVDESNAPLGGVRIVRRGTFFDEIFKMQMEQHFKRQGKKPPPDIGVRPRMVNDALRNASPLARTGDDGRFEVTQEPPAGYSFLFVKDGFAVREEKTLGHDMRVVLTAVQPLHGVARDTAGAPIERATVRASAPGETQETETDAKGRYRFASLPASVRAVYAFADGYDPEHVREPKTDAPVDFRLRRRWVIVDVEDAVTKAPPGHSLALLTAKDGQPFERLLTGGHSTPGSWDRRLTGRHTLGPDPTKLLAKQETVEAFVNVLAPGYRPAREPIVFRRDEEPPHVRVKLRRGAGPPSLQGRVRGAAPAHLELRNANSIGRDGQLSLLMEFDTDEQGRFLLSGLPLAEYQLVASAPGTGKVSRTFETPARDIVIELEPAAELEVVVSNADGKRVFVHVQQPRGYRLWEKRTDERGRAVFSGLPAETLLVRAAPESSRPAMGLDDMPMKEVVLRAGRRVRTSVALPERIRTVITIRDEQGRPRAGVPLGLQGWRGVVRVVGAGEYRRLSSLELETNAAGQAAVDLYAGSYVVTQNKLRLGEMKVTAESATAAFVVPEGGATLRGRVREYGNDRPITAMLLHIRDRDENKQLTNPRLDREGRFEVKGLPRHRVYLSMMPREPGLGRVTYAGGYCEVDLREKDTVELLDIRLPRLTGEGAVERPVVIDATVLRAAGRTPLEKATVSVSIQLGPARVRLGDFETDANGHGSLAVMRAAEYRVSAYLGGMQSEERTVSGDGRIELEFALRPRK